MGTRVISKKYSDVRDQNRGSTKRGATESWWQNTDGRRDHAQFWENDGQVGGRRQCEATYGQGKVVVHPSGLGERPS